MHRLLPSIQVLWAEVSTEAVGGRSRGRLCTALKRRLVGVQILLCEVWVHFCKAVEVGWKDKDTMVAGALGVDI